MAIFFCIFFIISCSHNEKKETVVKEKKGNIKDEMLAVYNKIIDGIKTRDLEQIISCYEKNSIFEYSNKIAHQFQCFNKESSIKGIDNITQQYQYFFENRPLDQIEFAIKEINEKEICITFINAWTYSDYRIAETIYLISQDNGYFIKKHEIRKYD